MAGTECEVQSQVQACTYFTEPVQTGSNVSEPIQILTGEFDNFIYGIVGIWAIIHLLVIKLPKNNICPCAHPTIGPDLTFSC